MNPVHYSSASGEWETPQNLYDALDHTFHFTLDPCASQGNAKCAKFYTKEQDGLEQSWAGEVVFMNPPYGREIGKWVRKAFLEWKHNGVPVVLLLPARTDTTWFHECCIYAAAIHFIRGRLHFGGAKNGAPFPSMLVYFVPYGTGKLEHLLGRSVGIVCGNWVAGA